MVIGGVQNNLSKTIGIENKEVVEFGKITVNC
jgi:hypothetical protein